MANKGVKGFKSKLFKSWKTFSSFGNPRHGKVKHVVDNNNNELSDDNDSLYELTFESTPAPTYGRRLIAPPDIAPSPLNPSKSFKTNLPLHRYTASTLDRLLDSDDPLRHFEDKCPPYGKNSIVLYTTSLRGVRRTFEDCLKVKSLLENLNVHFHERDISMDLGYREELWDLLGWRATPPRLFIQGKYIGGAEVTLGLHEQEKLLPLLQWIPKKKTGKCEGCGSMGFVMCSECHGSKKIVYDRADGREAEVERCVACNENGLVTCPICS